MQTQLDSADRFVLSLSLHFVFSFEPGLGLDLGFVFGVEPSLLVPFLLNSSPKEREYPHILIVVRHLRGKATLSVSASNVCFQ